MLVPNIDALPAEVNITSHLEKHNSNNVTVLLSLWTPLDQDMYSSLYSYQFSAVPPLEIQFAGRRSVRTQVLYNTLYNVSVTGVCVMNSIALYYGKVLY